MCFSRSFLVSDYVLSSVNRNFFSLHVNIYFSLHPLLKRLCFLQRVFLPPLSSVIWLLMHRFTSGPLIQFPALYVCFYAGIILCWFWLLCDLAWNQDVRCHHLCSFLRLLWLFGVFCCFIQILGLWCVCFSVSVKNAIGILRGIALNLWVV